MEDSNSLSLNGEDSCEQPHTPPYFVGSSVESDNGNIIAAVDSDLLFTPSKPTQVAFRKSNMMDCAQIVHQILVPSYFELLTEHQWIYPDSTSRYYAIASAYTRIVENVINQPPHSNCSYVAYNANDFNCIVGHILLSPPTSTQCMSAIRKELYWSQPLRHGLFSVWKAYQVRVAIDMMYAHLQLFCHKFWTANLMSIKPIWQGQGYGTFMLRQSHALIREQNQHNKSEKNDKIPIVVFSLSEKSTQFYLKNGYEIFMSIEIDLRSNVILCGMLHHYEKNVQKQLMAICKDKTKYNTRLNVCQHIIPQTIWQWIQCMMVFPLFVGYALFGVLCALLGVERGKSSLS